MKFGKFTLTDWVQHDYNDSYYYRLGSSSIPPTIDNSTFSVVIERKEQNYTSWELSLWSVKFHDDAQCLQEAFNSIHSSSTIIDSRIGLQNKIDKFLIDMNRLKAFI